VTLRGSSTVLAAALLSAACDPCGTTVRCSRPPTLAVVGQIVDSSGRSVGNVQLEMRRQSGGVMTAPIAVARSASDGSFEMSAPASDPGAVDVTISVSAPEHPPYVAQNVRVNANTQTGDATVLRPWLASPPEFPYVVIVVSESDGLGIAGASLTFQRTGGVRLFLGGAPVASYSFPLRGATTDTSGVMIGDITVQLPAGGVLVLPGFTFVASPEFHPPHNAYVIRVP
jgi:hypothetical protein